MQLVQRKEHDLNWKIKGIAAKLSYRLFCKYGTSKELPHTSNENLFKNSFTLNIAPGLLDPHMQIVFKKKTHFVGSQLLIYSIKFLLVSIRIPVTFSILEPFVENLLFETIIPALMVSAYDSEIFKNEPIEFIRKLEQAKASENDFSVRHHMLDLLYGICSYKVNKNDERPFYLGKFLEFCISNLNHY